LHPLRPARKYLLTAERLDVKDYIRWAVYYPRVAKRAQARTIEVHAGENVSDLQFSVGKVRIHTVLFHIVSADGSLLPLEKFGVSRSTRRSAGAGCTGVPSDADQKHQWRISGRVRSPGELFGADVSAAGPEDREASSGTIALPDGETRDVYRNGLGNYP
jgi:hypothetical protein